MLEVKVAVQAITKTKLIEGLNIAIKKIQEDQGAIPIDIFQKDIKVRMVIIEEAENSNYTSFKELDG